MASNQSSTSSKSIQSSTSAKNNPFSASTQKYYEYKLPKEFPLEHDTEMCQIMEVVKTMMRKEGASDEVIEEKLQRLQEKKVAEAADRMVKLESADDLISELVAAIGDCDSNPIIGPIATIYSSTMSSTQQWKRFGAVEEDGERLASGFDKIFKEKCPEHEFKDGLISNVEKSSSQDISVDVRNLMTEDFKIWKSNSVQRMEIKFQETLKKLRRMKILEVLEGKDSSFIEVAAANADLEIEDVVFRYVAVLLQPLVDKPKGSGSSKKKKKNRTVKTESGTESISESLKKRIGQIFEDLKEHSVRETFAHHQFRVSTVDDVKVANRLQEYNFWVGGKVKVVGREVVVADRCVRLGIEFEYVDA